MISRVIAILAISLLLNETVIAQCYIYASNYGSCQVAYGTQGSTYCSGCVDDDNPYSDDKLCQNTHFKIASTMPSSVWVQLRRTTFTFGQDGFKSGSFLIEACGDEGDCAEYCVSVIEGGVVVDKCVVSSSWGIFYAYVDLFGACP